MEELMKEAVKWLEHNLITNPNLNKRQDKSMQTLINKIKKELEK